MKTITFSYTKKDNSTSERTLLALTTPGNDKYAGVDVTDLDPNSAAEFIARAKMLHEDYVVSLRSLQEEFDLSHNYRQFLVSGMDDIVEI